MPSWASPLSCKTQKNKTEIEPWLRFQNILGLSYSFICPNELESLCYVLKSPTPPAPPKQLIRLLIRIAAKLLIHLERTGSSSIFRFHFWPHDLSVLLFHLSLFFRRTIWFSSYGSYAFLVDSFSRTFHFWCYSRWSCLAHSVSLQIGMIELGNRDVWL